MKRGVAALIAALWLVFAGSASADVFDDNPATASRGVGDSWMFARAANGETLERHWTGSAWTDWASLGGNAESGPAAVGYGNSMLVFVRGAASAIHQNTFTDGKWSGWVSLGGYATSAPAATVRRGPQGYVDLAVKGGDNAIWFRTYVPGTGWTGWASRGGSLTAAPAMQSQADGIVNIWARGTDGALKQQAWNGAAWSEWGNLEGTIYGAPASVSRTEQVVNVYARGVGNTVYQRAWTSTAGWYPWALLDPTPVDSSPAAGGDGPNHEWVIARKGANLVRKDWDGASGWTGWVDMGPIAVPSPPAPPAPPPPDGELSIETGVRCTPPGGRLRVDLEVRKPKGNKKKALVTRIVFYTKGKGRSVRVDRKAPFVVRIKINRPAGTTGRVYARVYYKRSARGKLVRKTVSRRYTVCR